MVHFVCILILLIKKTIILSIKYPQYTKAWNSPFAKSESLILWVSSSRHCIAWMDLSSFIVLRMSILLPLKVCLPGWPCRSGAVLQIHPSSSVSIKSKLEGSQILGSCNPAGNRQMLWRYDPTKNKQKKAPKIYKCNLWVHSIALYPLAVFVFVVFFAVILNCEFPIRDLLILKLEEEQLIQSARGVYAFLLLSPPLLDLHETSMTATSVHAALSLQPFKYMI